MVYGSIGGKPFLQIFHDVSCHHYTAPGINIFNLSDKLQIIFYGSRGHLDYQLVISY